MIETKVDKKKSINFNWKCKHTWKKSAKNTSWCLLGCSIGDFGTILFFQLSAFNLPVIQINKYFARNTDFIKANEI